MPTLGEVADALRELGGDPQRTNKLAISLGCKPIPSPIDFLGGSATPFNTFLESRFGVRELYRTGSIQTDIGTVGFYLALLDDWMTRSVDRERARRRVARALVDLQDDARSFFSTYKF